MSIVTLLPHAELCPAGARFEAAAGSSLCDAMLAAGIAIEHACEKVAACATCHVYVRSGSTSLAAPSDEEEDQLDDAWGVEPDSRLACCVRLGPTDLTIELPTHTRNHARE